MKYLFLLFLIVIAIIPISWSQNAPVVSAKNNGEAANIPAGELQTDTRCLQKPVRPTTALQVYHYVMAVFPLRKTDQLRYEIQIGGGVTISVPYSVTEEEAKRRLYGYHDHPFSGLSQEELGLLIELLSPPVLEGSKAVTLAAAEANAQSPDSLKLKGNIADSPTMLARAIGLDGGPPVGSEGSSNPVPTACRLAPSISNE